METISRKDAKAKGMKRYYTGKICKNGHTAERFVCNYECIVCDADRKEKRKVKHVKAVVVKPVLKVVGVKTKKVRVVKFEHVVRKVVGKRKYFSPVIVEDKMVEVAV